MGKSWASRNNIVRPVTIRSGGQRLSKVTTNMTTICSTQLEMYIRMEVRLLVLIAHTSSLTREKEGNRTRVRGLHATVRVKITNFCPITITKVATASYSRRTRRLARRQPIRWLLPREPGEQGLSRWRTRVKMGRTRLTWDVQQAVCFWSRTTQISSSVATAAPFRIHRQRCACLRARSTQAICGPRRHVPSTNSLQQLCLYQTPTSTWNRQSKSQKCIRPRP